VDFAAESRHRQQARRFRVCEDRDVIFTSSGASTSSRHHPPPGRRNAPPDDRLRRMIQ
jgi:hypothetical protein